MISFKVLGEVIGRVVFWVVVCGGTKEESGNQMETGFSYLCV